MSDSSSKIQEVKGQVDAALDTVYAKLVEAVPGSEEHLKTAEAKTAVPPKYLVGGGLALVTLSVVALLMLLDLHTLVLKLLFWVALSYRSFRAIDHAHSGAITTEAQKKELKHLLAYSIVNALVMAIDPVLRLLPGYVYVKYTLLTFAYYADQMDNALVTFIKAQILPLIHAVEGTSKSD